MSNPQIATPRPASTTLPVIDIHYVRQVVTDWWANPAFDRAYDTSVYERGFSFCMPSEDIASLLIARELLDAPKVDRHAGATSDGCTIVRIVGTYRGVQASAFSAFADPDATVAALTAQAGA